MKQKYEIELTINDVTNKGYMEIYDDSLMIYIDNQSRTIIYKKIKDNLIEKGLLKLTLNDGTTLFIKSIEIEYIQDFIELQRNEEDNYPISFKTKKYYTMKFFIISFIVILLVILLLSGFNVDGFSFGVYIFWSLVFAIPATIYKNAHNLESDRATGICPHCKKQLIIQHKIGNDRFSMNENEVNTMTCSYCSNMIGVKYNHLYKLTTQNESKFNIKQIKEKQNGTNNNENISTARDFDKLEKLKELLDKKVITQEDYDTKKEEILKKM